MNQTLKISIARGGCRFASPLYLGSFYVISFEGARSDEAKKVLFVKPRSQNPDNIDGIVGLAESVVDTNGITLSLNRNALVEWFKSNRACDVDSYVDAHCYVFNEDGEVLADSPITIEYSPTLFFIDTKDYPLAREVLSQAIIAKKEAVIAKVDAELAKLGAEKAKDKTEEFKNDAKKASSVATESAETSSVAKRDAVTAKNAAQDAKDAAEKAASTAETALEKMVASAKEVVGGVELLLWNGQGNKPSPIFIPHGIDGVTGYVKCDEDGKYYCLKCKEVDGEKVLVLEQVGVNNVTTAGYVRSVNGTTPNSDGNVTIPLNFLPLTGGTIKGILQIDNDDAINRNSNNNSLSICGGSGIGKGARLVLTGRDSSDNGLVYLESNDGDAYVRLLLLPDGKIYLYNKDGVVHHLVRSINNELADANGNVKIPLQFLPLTGGTIKGNISFLEKKEAYIKNETDAGVIGIRAGTEHDSGCTLYLYHKNHEDGARFVLLADDGNNNIQLIGKPDGTLTWGNNDVLTAENVENYVSLNIEPDVDGLINITSAVSSANGYTAPCSGFVSVMTNKPGASTEMTIDGVKVAYSYQYSGDSHGGETKQLFALISEGQKVKTNNTVGYGVFVPFK